MHCLSMPFKITMYLLHLILIQYFCYLKLLPTKTLGTGSKDMIIWKKTHWTILGVSGMF